MKVLVIGAGGREHCLVWKLGQSPLIEQIFCIPGNGGTARAAKTQNIALDPLNFEALAMFAQMEYLNWTFVGPEQPLAQGIVDYFLAMGMAIIGPTQEGAQIESSKAWAKALMAQAKIPTAQAQVFTELAMAKAQLEHRALWPVVVKADGLALGKGVVIAPDLVSAHAALVQCFALSEQVIIEDFLVGEELSVLALTDGRVIVPLLAAQDHKTIGEGDTGPNTGGMGAFAPVPLATESVMQRVYDQVLVPTLKALQARGIDYRGILYAGLMIDREGQPWVVEFNCRLGDPETQAILPLLATDFAEICQALIDQTLEDIPLTWHAGSSVCVVAVAEGYPGSYPSGDEITGIDRIDGGIQVFQAGTRLDGDMVRTAGGRVLGITGVGNNLREALHLSYTALEKIHFSGMYYRRDIGFRIK